MEKINELVAILERFQISEVLEIEQKYDEQYKALQFLFEGFRDRKKFCLLVLLNALVCYQLSGTGERYWWEFAKHFRKKKVEDPIGELKNFLRVSRFNRRLLEVKLKRLTRLRKLLPKLYTEIGENRINYEKLRGLIARSLNAKPTSKTVVFSMKMLNYACRITKREGSPLPMALNMPVDLRIREISNKLGVNEKIEDFWDNMAEKVGIPPLHIDSLLWITCGLIKNKVEIKNKKLSELANFLKSI